MKPTKYEPDGQPFIHFRANYRSESLVNNILLFRT